MRKPLAIVTSDTHLDWQAWERREGLVGDAYWSFGQIIDDAAVVDVPLFLLGDVTNTKTPSSQTVAMIRSHMEVMRGLKLPVYYIQGQHEAADPTWLAAASDWPSHVHDVTFCLPGRPDIGFHGIDWTPADRLPDLLHKISKGVDVVLLHQVTEEFMGKMRKCDLSLESVPHAGLCMIGDFHKHMNIEVLNATASGMRVYSAGSTCMRAIDEPPKKGYYLLYDDLSVESRWLKTRPVLQPPLITTEDRLDQFIEEVGSQVQGAFETAESLGMPDHICKPLLWVHYVEGLPKAWPRIVAAVDGKAFLFRRVHLLETEEKAAEKEKRHKRTGKGPVAALGELLPDEESFVYKAGRRLLETDESLLAVELRKLRSEYGLSS